MECTFCFPQQMQNRTSFVGMINRYTMIIDVCWRVIVRYAGKLHTTRRRLWKHRLTPRWWLTQSKIHHSNLSIKII